MRTRDLLILSGALCLASVAGIAMLSQNSFVEAFSPHEARTPGEVVEAAALADPNATRPNAAGPSGTAVEAVIQRGEENVDAAHVETCVRRRVLVAHEDRERRP
ncbi:MAG: hypothetical protein ABIP94_15295, partial [Planctomycetota bacterium]